MMRVLITTTVPETLATILKDQPVHLAQHFEVALVTSPGKEFAQVVQNERLITHAVPMTRGISVLNDLTSVVRMMLVLRKVRPALVHSYTPKAGLVTMLAAWLCRVPVRVHTFTGLIFPTELGLRQKLLIWVDRLICACATQIVPEGLGVKHDLEHFRITRKPLRVIGHGNIAGVNTDHFSPTAPNVQEAAAELKRSFGLGPQAFLFCFVGRLNKDKGISELVEAFNTLPAAAHLLLIGGVDASAPVDAATMAAVKSSPRIHSMGFLDDIRPALRAADLLVLPSYREGFPNVVLQAGAMALPVIATDINGCNEVIEPGFNGWLVPPRDSRALEGAMRQAMQAPALLRVEMGKQARFRIQQRFERRQHWERMVAFYQVLLGAPGRVPASGGRKFLLIAGLSESLLNFRGPLIAALQARGFQVHVAAPDWPQGHHTCLQLETQGLTVHNTHMRRTGTNPIGDLATLWALWRLMHRVQPQFVMGYTIKPVIYGSLAAWLAGVPRRFALITGLGYAFQGEGEGQRGRLQALVQRLYALALSRVNLVFFQNPDDEALFRGRGILAPGTPSCVVNGSGVDVASFAVVPLPLGPPRFLLIGRLLGDKGVREYAQAASRIRARHPECHFDLVGWLDENPNAIKQAELDAWVSAGTVRFLGRMTDVRPAIANCSVYVLPSYREGTPRTVLEAMAMGRAIITTDAPGCRETVVHEDNGLLIPVKSASALEQAMMRFIEDPALAQRMGLRGRLMAEDKYDVHKVNAVMLREMGID
jgi:glycosyltransferase involved in cell wall biosynthesis